MSTPTARTFLFTALALVAFAANSVLCRLALETPSIDPASFSTVRLVSGAITLSVISLTTGRATALRSGGSWSSALVLFLYAVPFSYAYISLDAGTGALLLFGAVQATMLIAALRAGERPRRGEWIGLGLAIAGLVYLVSPGLSAPEPVGSALMVAAGICWGLYSLRGRSASDPIVETTGNFVRAIPFVLLLTVFAGESHASSAGIELAIASGAVASGIGYVIWYAALSGLSATRAATVQLAVPVIAALGGVMLLGERVSFRLAAASVLILGGVGLSLRARRVR